MPKCKNNLKKTYKGTEPSPKGKGWCAGGMEEGVTKKGTDGNKWIVSADKNGNKRWKKDTKTKSNTTGKTKSTPKSTTKSKTKSPDKNGTPVDSRPFWVKALDYLFNGKTTYLDADKPLYIRITPMYYTQQWVEEKDDGGWSDGGTRDFKFTKKNKPSNKDIVKFYKKFMLNKRKGLSLKEYLDLTHFKFIDVYTVGNKIEYKFKCMSCIHPTNGHILTPNRATDPRENGWLRWNNFGETLTDGFGKHTGSGDPIKFIKVDKQQVYVGIWGEGVVTTYQK